ncbi:hypothetical protein CRI85_04110 [Leuconostoc pseudomesenteroides]|uniref:hypothetical protein n=1 Tax=Leuconostoc pseudomesenteroides TaxID=33968 RepID=UPI001E2ED02C|nr:hypothetical protein [Leuconostoc pseudomesenteroides]MCC8439528.1 hypothetical protein [Leuconostoc pseudomesenteroides]
MAGITKTVRNIDNHALEVIEVHALKEDVTANQLIRELIEAYAQRLERMDASKKLDADIDELIDANNNLIQAHNDNTLVFGELAKKIISRLDFYLPPLADDIEQIQNNARPQEKKLPKSINFDEFE